MVLQKRSTPCRHTADPALRPRTDTGALVQRDDGSYGLIDFERSIRYTDGATSPRTTRPRLGGGHRAGVTADLVPHHAGPAANGGLGHRGRSPGRVTPAERRAGSIWNSVGPPVDGDLNDCRSGSWTAVGGVCAARDPDGCFPDDYEGAGVEKRASTRNAGGPVDEADPRIICHERSAGWCWWCAPGELYPDRLLTSLGRYEAEALLKVSRGKAEGHMGELMDVLDPALSSATGPRRTIGANRKPEAKPEVRPHNEVLFLLNLLGYEILHLGRVLMEQARLESASFSRAGVASGISGAASGEAIDFRHQSRGDGLEAVVAETGAGVLGAGIVDGGEIGTETVGISHRKVNLSAGDGPPGRYGL